MTPREIIEKAVAVARGDTHEGKYWAQLSPKSRDDAELGIRRLVAAGYRILGPDDLDEKTVERCAEVAESAGNTWSNTRDPFQACQEAAVDEKCTEIATAIRAALKEKQG